MGKRTGWDLLTGWLRTRAERDPNRIVISIASARAARTYQVELSRRMGRAVLGILVGMGLVILVGGVFYGIVLRDASLLGAVRKENAILRERADRFTELEQEVDRLDELRRQICCLAGVSEAFGGDSRFGSAIDSVSARSVDPSSTNGELTEPGLESSHWVIPLLGPVSRGFTLGRGDRMGHPGVDVAGAEGSPVAAAAGGRVIFAGWDATFGNLVILEHGNGWETKYGHARELMVARGASVQAGQTIACVGSTGQSSAPHLHFEVLKDGITKDPADHFTAYRPAVSDN